MNLNITIATKVKRREKEQISRVPRAHLSQYSVSEIINAMNAEIIRETVAKTPPTEIISAGKCACMFGIKATKLMGTHYGLR